jgi:hypothetical protein
MGGMLQEAFKAFVTQLSLDLLGRTDRTIQNPSPQVEFKPGIFQVKIKHRVVKSCSVEMLLFYDKKW